MNSKKICRIGQCERCSLTGCEWKKAFNKECSYNLINKNDIMVKHKKVVKKEKKLKKQKSVPVENNKVFVENKKIIEEDFTKKITIASQDDWIKKIKVK